jgi:hypothetical protein
MERRKKKVKYIKDVKHTNLDRRHKRTVIEKKER